MKKGKGKSAKHAMSIDAKCEACNKTFELNNANLKKEKMQIKTEFGDCIKDVLYYDCPLCDYRHFVQLDDEATEAIFDEMCSLAGELTSGKDRVTKAKFDRLRKQLGERREMYKQVYTGHVAEGLETKVSCVLRFTK